MEKQTRATQMRGQEPQRKAQQHDCRVMSRQRSLGIQRATLQMGLNRRNNCRFLFQSYRCDNEDAHVRRTVEFTEDARWTLIWRTAAPRPSVQFLVLAVLRARTRTQHSRYSYSSAALYSSLDSDTTSARPINRVNIDTMRRKIRFNSLCDSLSMPSVAPSTSWIEAHSSADPRAMSRNRLRSLRLRLPLPSAMLSGIDCAAQSQ